MLLNVSGAVSVARLIYTDSSNQERSVYLGPDQPAVLIGRASDCSIRTSRQSVSRHHAEFRYVDGTFEVADLNSSNGTWLIEEEQRFEISHERLEDGDEIWCGDFIVHFSLNDLPSEDPTGAGQFGMTPGQYVSGPTEAAPAFGAAGAPGAPQAQPAYADAGIADPSENGFDYSSLDELSAVEIVEPQDSNHAARPAAGGLGAEPSFGAQAELDRLREEKQSIEDLASRQTFEITDLQAKLDEANERLAQGSEALQAELDALRAENEQLQQQLSAAPQESEQLDAARAELEALQANLEQEQAQSEKLRADLANAEDESSARAERVAELEESVQDLRAQLESASDSGGDLEAARRELGEVRAELEKRNRLLNEYERRNADLRIEFDEQRQANAALREAGAQARAELEQAEAARDEAQRLLSEAQPAQVELEGARKDLQRAEELAEKLQAEVQGLKQRVQLERRRSKDADPEASEQLKAELARANERIAELEAQAAQLGEADAPSDASAPGLGAELVEALRERLGTLQRLSDAIVRADFEPLSTVDRIRLQSAIRETDPKKTLQEALELLE
jgi:pSer/pThr/pTyr-binding forkhead associated (FHA) protein